MQTATSKEQNQSQKIERLVLDNGITLILVENNAADLVAGRIFLKNTGARWDSLDQAGLSHLVASAIMKGTERLSSAEIAEQIESIGANLGADAAADYFLLSLKTVANDFGSILQLTAEILRSPTFLEEEVQLEKNLTLQSIRSQLEQPFNVAFKNLREAMYPNHPYGFSLLGTSETVSSLTRQDLIQYHQTHFRPDRLVVSLSGKIDLDRAVDLVDRTLGDWQVERTSNQYLQLPKLASQPSIVTVEQDTQQSIIMLGYLAAAVSQSEDYAALKLLSTYLGNGLSSRLFVELREKRGLAYDVSALYPTRLDSSQFVTYIGTAPENTEIAMEGLRSEVERLCINILPEEELQAAKNKLLGQYALGKQTNAEIAQTHGWYESLGLGIEFDREFPQAIDRVTAEQAHKVAQKYLSEPYISMVGPNISAIEMGQSN